MEQGNSRVKTWLSMSQQIVLEKKCCEATIITKQTRHQTPKGNNDLQTHVVVFVIVFSFYSISSNNFLDYGKCAKCTENKIIPVVRRTNIKSHVQRALFPQRNILIELNSVRNICTYFQEELQLSSVFSFIYFNIMHTNNNI